MLFYIYILVITVTYGKGAQTRSRPAEEEGKDLGILKIVGAKTMSMHPKNEKIKSDKYKREGAKYVCTKCKAKFFSKEDVEKCHDSHAPGG